MCVYTLPPSRCAPGTYGETEGSGSQCKLCSGGKYSAAKASSCINCPAAKTANTDRGACSQCPAGLVAIKPGSSECISCPAGTTALPWQNGCTKWSTQLKKLCKSNRFKESFKTFVVAQTVCLNQGPACSGVYNPESAGASAKFWLCKLGSFEVSTVADIIFTKPRSVCRAGTYASLAATNQTQCKICKVGRFDCSGNGVQCRGDVKATRCTFKDNSGSGVIVTGARASGELVDCVIRKNENHGVFVQLNRKAVLRGGTVSEKRTRCACIRRRRQGHGDEGRGGQAAVRLQGQRGARLGRVRHGQRDHRHPAGEDQRLESTSLLLELSAGGPPRHKALVALGAGHTAQHEARGAPQIAALAL